MISRKYTVRFITPAFLGDAEQRGRWRTPPFKALLRQWWRIAAAKDYDYDHGKLRKAEGELFGVAADKEGESRRSRVQLRLDHWDPGTGNSLQAMAGRWAARVSVGQYQVNPLVYLWYGAVDQKTRDLAHPPAVGPVETRRLTVRYPNEVVGEIEAAFQLLSWLGTLGSRSRNGAGSVVLDAESNGHLSSTAELIREPSALSPYARTLADCLNLDWPHAIGMDGKGLAVWCTRQFGDWLEVVQHLATLRIGLRRTLPLKGDGLSERHLLAYPIAQRPVHAWGQDARFPNQLRFKVVHGGDNGLVGLVFHVPCGVPRDLVSKLGEGDRKLVSPAAQQRVWQKVHEWLDRQPSLTRLGRA